MEKDNLLFDATYIQTVEQDGSKLNSTRKYIQHGNTSCLLHSIAVAYYSYRLAKAMYFINFNIRDLIRGALLHDYFLYDWHIPNPENKLHGFNHPKIAEEKAKLDFDLSNIERDIIKKHMFPLTIKPPKYKEAVIVCIIDKICSIYEIFKKSSYKNKEIRKIYTYKYPVKAAVLHN